MKTLAVRLVLFGLLAGASLVVAGPLVGLSGARGIGAAALYGLVTAAGVFGATVLCVRRTGSSLRAVGIEWTGKRGREVLLGFAIGAALFTAVLLVQGLMAGGSWERGGRLSLVGIGQGLVVVLCLLLSEELLFRGYAFRQLVDYLGPGIAVAISAAAFGVYHVLGSGNWDMGAVYTFVMSALGGVLFAYALLRSGSLALPLGLHWGGNWVQMQVLDLGQLPAQSSAVWAMPLTATQVRWIAAPDLVQHLPYLVAVALSCFVVRWVTQVREET